MAVAPVTFGRPWRVAGHIFCLALCLSVIAPLALVLGTAFKPANEIYDLTPWPRNPTFENFVKLVEETEFVLYLWNSLATTFLRVLGQLAIAVLAAYAFARWRFTGSTFVFALTLGAMMIPHQLVMIPIYIMIAELDWFDTWAALIIPNLAMPFAVFLLRQHMMSFPKDLLDAAEMDGAGPFTALWRVMLPNLGPALAALTIVLSIDCWNEYFWPLLVTDSPGSRTVQIGIRQFLEENFEDFGALMAGVTVASVPVLAVFFVLQRRIMETFVASGLKG
jgi:multiple sugar transport system permease protein/sn-glycerol 3-phosphate transport system permease protein